MVTFTHPIESRNPRAGGVAFAALLLAACQGPTLTIERPPAPEQDAACYVDGHLVPPGTGKDQGRARSRPVPYYGTAVLDAVPAPRDAGGEFQRVPLRTAVAMPEPVTPWLFPFDFLLEGIDRVLHGSDDHEVRAALAPNPAPAVQGFAWTGALEVRRRALAARTAR